MNFFDIETYVIELEETEKAEDMHESLTGVQVLYQEGDEYV